VIGDMAALEMQPGQLVPGLAPAAIQEGKHAAQMILRSLRNSRAETFTISTKAKWRPSEK